VTFPWSRYPREGLVLLLVALAALGPVYATTWQDSSRLALTQSLVDDGRVEIDRFAGQTGDKSFRGGHFYTDKAPGVSLLALVPFAAFRAVGVVVPAKGANGVWNQPRSLWIFRLLIGGLAFLVGNFLVGRVAEGLRPGTGALSAATLGVGTLALPLAATIFGHLVAGVLCLGAFLLLWLGGRRAWPDVAAGLCAGLAIVVEYQAALIAVILLGYVFVARRSAWAAARFAAGAVPGAAILGAYDWAAFGSPVRLSYDYVYGRYSEDQQHGFFGIGSPHGHTIRRVLVDSDRGLLVTSPVLALATAGLVLLWLRGRRAEAATCAAVTAVFLVVEAGYFLPFGGVSPGPRFFVPALPFLALGLPLAYGRWPRLTGFLALASLAILAPLTAGWRVGGGPWWDWAGGSMTWFMHDTSRTVVAAAALVLGAAALAAGALGSRRVG
jgi:hypothetical protein